MKNKKGSVFITIGLLLIAAALLLAGYNLWDEHRAEQSVNAVMKQINLPQENPQLPDYLIDPNIEMPTENIDGWDYIGVLEIPAFDLTLPVISRWSNAALKVAPARYEGSAYTDYLIIAAHNYKTHFDNLQYLVAGDEVYFTDIDGNRFSYEVVMTEILKPTDVEQMSAGDWDLTLFTCNYGGSYRVTVRCDRTEYIVYDTMK